MQNSFGRACQARLTYTIYADWTLSCDISVEDTALALLEENDAPVDRVVDFGAVLPPRLLLEAIDTEKAR